MTTAIKFQGYFNIGRLFKKNMGKNILDWR